MLNHRQDFPIFNQKIHGQPLVYLDNAATSQKPRIVIDAVSHFYQHDYANIHRGVYELSERATAQYETVREKTRKFINAQESAEIIFTRGTTEAINLVAYCFAEMALHPGDEILISAMEHHSNIVPWQIACERKGAKLKIIPVLDDGTLDLKAYAQLLTPHTKLMAITHVSNVLGTINPIKEMIQLAHAKNILVLVDGAQATPHMPVDVRELDADFYTFSSHKMYGPTGVGVLYGKRELLEKLPPYQSGGDMISRVRFEKTEYNVLPHKFEAGTPNIAGIIGFGAALDYLTQLGMETIAKCEADLLTYATEQLQTVSGLKIMGHVKSKAAVISFVMPQAHPHDIATVLDHEGIAIRAGHHCAMPLIERFHVPATARASMGIYNNREDIDRLVLGLNKVIELFGAD